MDDKQNTGNNRWYFSPDDYAAMALAADELMAISSGIRRGITKCLGEHYRALSGRTVKRGQA